MKWIGEQVERGAGGGRVGRSAGGDERVEKGGGGDGQVEGGAGDTGNRGLVTAGQAVLPSCMRAYVRDKSESKEISLTYECTRGVVHLHHLYWSFR